MTQLLVDDWVLRIKDCSKFIRSECCNSPIHTVQTSPAFQMDLELIECFKCGRGLGVIYREDQ